MTIVPCDVPFSRSSAASCGAGGGDGCGGSCADDFPGGGCFYCAPGFFSPLPKWYGWPAACVPLVAPSGALSKDDYEVVLACPAEPDYLDPDDVPVE